jgi:uncharacterized protein
MTIVPSFRTLMAASMPALALSLSLSLSAPAQADTARFPPVTLPGTQDRLVPMAPGRPCCRLLISVPEGKAPPAGWPVIYILDGNSVFGTVRDEVRRESADTYEAPAVIVAIGYPGDDPWNDSQRQHDLTPALPATRAPIGPAGYAIPDTGGAEVFLDYIANVVKPAIARDFPIDPARQTLAGHSLGGLFTLYAAFTRPDLFQTYAAMSPSIWYGDRYILDIEDKTRPRRSAQKRHARLLLTIGGCEQTPGECDPGVPGSVQKNDWLQWQGRMLDDVRLMAERLNAAPTGIDAQAVVFAGEHHESVLGASIARMVRFALSPAEQRPAAREIKP